jgi:hypothetical protein
VPFPVIFIMSLRINITIMVRTVIPIINLTLVILIVYHSNISSFSYFTFIINSKITSFFTTLQQLNDQLASTLFNMFKSNVVRYGCTKIWQAVFPLIRSVNSISYFA